MGVGPAGGALGVASASDRDGQWLNNSNHVRSAFVTIREYHRRLF